MTYRGTHKQISASLPLDEAERFRQRALQCGFKHPSTYMTLLARREIAASDSDNFEASKQAYGDKADIEVTPP